MGTNNVKICPYCNDDILTITERMEDAGIIPTDDPVKSAEIAEKKKNELLSEKEKLSAQQKDLILIVEGFSDDALLAAKNEIRKRYDKHFSDEKLSDKYNGYKKALNKVCEFLKEITNELYSTETELGCIDSKLQAFQLPLGLS